MKKSRKYTAILLALITVMTWMLGGCSKTGLNTTLPENSEITVAEVPETEQDLTGLLDNTWQAPNTGEKTSEGNKPAAGTYESGLDAFQYEHYDPTDFLDNCGKLEGMSDKGEIGEITSLYEKLLADLIHVQDLYTLADLRANEDVTDESREEEKTYTYDILVDMDNAFGVACKKILKGTNGKDFAAYLDDDYVQNYYETYVELTPELKQLLTDEENLENKYYDVINTYEDVTYMYNGKLYRLGDILNDNAFYSSDPDGYFEVYSGCLKSINDEVGEIYVKLVKIRDKIAKIHGYDNYCEYADKEIFGRDYPEKDLEKFKKGVKEFGGDFWMYYQYLGEVLPDYDATGDDIVDDARKCIDGISPYADEATRFMADNRYYSIGDEENRIEAGYTAALYETDKPFIYFKTGNGVWDLISIVHEMGHYTDMYKTPNPHPQCGDGSYDLFEIHSTGLQLLAGENYKDVIGEGGPLVEAYTIFMLMTYVSDGCMYDEWEREIYKNPDMTLDEINALYKKLSLEYGSGSDYPGSEYLWMFIHHHFTSPMYYISYATSAIASLQIGLMSADDYDGAVKAWEKIIEDSAYDKGYQEVVEDAGLKYFNNDKEVKKILKGVFDQAVGIVTEGN